MAGRKWFIAVVYSSDLGQFCCCLRRFWERWEPLSRFQWWTKPHLRWCNSKDHHARPSSASTGASLCPSWSTLAYRQLQTDMAQAGSKKSKPSSILADRSLQKPCHEFRKVWHHQMHSPAGRGPVLISCHWRWSCSIQSLKSASVHR